MMLSICCKTFNVKVADRVPPPLTLTTYMTGLGDDCLLFQLLSTLIIPVLSASIFSGVQSAMILSRIYAGLDETLE